MLSHRAKILKNFLETNKITPNGLFKAYEDGVVTEEEFEIITGQTIADIIESHTNIEE